MNIFKKIILIVLAICLCIGAYFIAVNIINKNKENTKEKEIISNEKLYELADFPKVDASLATQPLVNAMVANFTGIPEKDFDESVLNYTNTHPGYVKLINDEVDLIVVTQPSKEELELAKQKGVELEVIPVVKEGFVFYVNSQNPVDSLTVEQIQKIYTGEIKNWKEVGRKWWRDNCISKACKLRLTNRNACISNEWTKTYGCAKRKFNRHNGSNN